MALFAPGRIDVMDSSPIRVNGIHTDDKLARQVIADQYSKLESEWSSTFAT